MSMNISFGAAFLNRTARRGPGPLKGPTSELTSAAVEPTPPPAPPAKQFAEATAELKEVVLRLRQLSRAAAEAHPEAALGPASLHRYTDTMYGVSSQLGEILAEVITSVQFEDARGRVDTTPDTGILPDRVLRSIAQDAKHIRTELGTVTERLNDIGRAAHRLR